MNYLNEEYKNLSDLDKKNILLDIIKFLQEEKQKVDDKINGAENSRVFLKKLDIEESDIEGLKEEIKYYKKYLVELKEALDNNEITQEEYDNSKEELTKEIEEYTKGMEEEQKKLSLNDVLEYGVVLKREYESGYEGEWTRDDNHLYVDIICTDNLKIHVSYNYCFDNNDHDSVFYQRYVI